MRGRVVVVTGANTGIGFHTAKRLHARGATVVLACRSAQRAQAAADAIGAAHGATHGQASVAAAMARVEVHPLDLSSLQSVRAFAQRWYSTPASPPRDCGAQVATGGGRTNNKAAVAPPVRPCHVLVLNAGVNSFGGQGEATTADGLNLVYGVNFVAHAALSLLMLPALQAAAGDSWRPRVVALTSVTHRSGDGDFAPAARTALPLNYSNSKLALAMWSHELQRRLHAAGAPPPACLHTHAHTQTRSNTYSTRLLQSRDGTRSLLLVLLRL